MLFPFIKIKTFFSTNDQIGPFRCVKMPAGSLAMYRHKHYGLQTARCTLYRNVRKSRWNAARLVYTRARAIRWHTEQTQAM